MLQSAQLLGCRVLQCLQVLSDDLMENSCWLENRNRESDKLKELSLDKKSSMSYQRVFTQTKKKILLRQWVDSNQSG